MRLNDVDWLILETMGDGRRYTQEHLDKDIEAFADVSDSWLRKRMTHLHDNALVERVGSSSMYEITEYGRAALELRDELEGSALGPVETGKRIRDRAADRREEH